MNRSFTRFASVASLALVAGLVVPVSACSVDEGDDVDYGNYEPRADYCAAATTCGSCTPLNGCGWCAFEGGGGRCATGPGACGNKPFRWNWDPNTCPVDGDAGTDAIVPAEASIDDSAAPVDTGSAPVDSGSVSTPLDAATDSGPAADAGSEAAADAESEAAADAESEAAADSGTSADTGSAPTDTGSAPTDTGTAPTDTTVSCKIPDAASSGACAPTSGGSLCGSGQYTLGCHGGTPNASLACTKALTTSDGAYYCCTCGS